MLQTMPCYSGSCVGLLLALVCARHPLLAHASRTSAAAAPLLAAAAAPTAAASAAGSLLLVADIQLLLQACCLHPLRTCTSLVSTGSRAAAPTRMRAAAGRAIGSSSRRRCACFSSCVACSWHRLLLPLAWRAPRPPPAAAATAAGTATAAARAGIRTLGGSLAGSGLLPPAPATVSPLGCAGAAAARPSASFASVSLLVCRRPPPRLLLLLPLLLPPPLPLLLPALLLLLLLDHLQQLLLLLDLHLLRLNLCQRADLRRVWDVPLAARSRRAAALQQVR